MKLKTLHQAGVREPLQSPLRGRHGTRGVDVAVELAREHVVEAGNHAEHLQIRAIRVEGPG
jgi:hypothetical protein